MSGRICFRDSKRSPPIFASPHSTYRKPWSRRTRRTVGDVDLPLFAVEEHPCGDRSIDSPLRVLLYDVEPPTYMTLSRAPRREPECRPQNRRMPGDATKPSCESLLPAVRRAPEVSPRLLSCVYELEWRGEAANRMSLTALFVERPAFDWWPGTRVFCGSPYLSLGRRGGRAELASRKDIPPPRRPRKFQFQFGELRSRSDRRDPDRHCSHGGKRLLLERP